MLQSTQTLMADLIDEVVKYYYGGIGVMSGDQVVHRVPPAN
ncbi:hypothetical protein [Acinetobacter pittii]|nr:hypothetical protein [Acinetobacter pittii]